MKHFEKARHLCFLVSLYAGCLHVCVPHFRKKLELLGAFDNSRRITPSGNETVSLPVLASAIEVIKNSSEVTSAEKMWIWDNMHFKLEKASSISGEKIKKQCHRASLLETAQKLAREFQIPWTPEMEADLPCNWEKHGDLILLPGTSFQLDLWEGIGNKDTSHCPDVLCSCLSWTWSLMKNSLNLKVEFTLQGGPLQEGVTQSL